MYAFLIYCLIALLMLLLVMATLVTVQAVGDGIKIVQINDWGGGYNATFQYQLRPDDTPSGSLEAWRFDVDYFGAAQLASAWMPGYGGRYFGYSGQYQITKKIVAISLIYALATVYIVLTIQSKGSDLKRLIF